MVNTHHRKVLNSSTSKVAEPSASDVRHDDNDNSDVPKFDGALDLIASTRCLIAVEEIDDNVFRIDLIPIMLGVFDIVIGMDWLDKYNANILCSKKLVWVINPQGCEVVIYGDIRKGDLKLCSVMKARRFLLRGCHAFIAHVINTNFEKKSVEDVPIINEFLNIFPEELSGDFVMLKVSPWKGVLRFKNKGKLSHRKCLAKESSVITLDDVEIDPELTSQEEPITTLGRKSRQLRNKIIPLVKVEWKHQKGTSIKWEPEVRMRIIFPHLFQE
nr:hypothetical protein [Tanacetum cinerariifolium]